MVGDDLLLAWKNQMLQFAQWSVQKVLLRVEDDGTFMMTSKG
jgi:hypothetical protein